jgi:alkyldihydroxyacetonephosphate synthase
MRWWGWGEDERAPGLPEGAEELLAEQFGVQGGRISTPVALEDVVLPEPALHELALQRLQVAVGEEHVLDDREARVRHAAGRSYPDLVRLRAGDASGAPDAVVLPGTKEQVAAVLEICAELGVAVIPFGGGTSVVGGVEPLRGELDSAITLDLSRLDRVLEVDPKSLTATLEAGISGPAAEAALGEQGLTLGHFPQSFEHSTVGGWLATRSAGQASTGYGRSDELVEGLRFLAPAGELRVPAVPGSAAGPALRELLVGSEGVLGVICEATLRVRPAPQHRRYEGWSFKSFEEGCEALRVLEQAGAAPDVARLSDEDETRLTLAMAGNSTATKLAERYLSARGHAGGCIAIVGFEGTEEEAERRRQRGAALLRAGGGLALGSRPGKAWLEGRYEAPYLRDELLDRGVMVETLETATSWTRLGYLHATVKAAITGALEPSGTRPVVMCHVSHLYPSGASLYFTFLAQQQSEKPLEQWWAAKTAASEAIIAGGGTITHHHAVGRDHAYWLGAEVGELGLELIAAAKERLDPAGIMNPGKLLPVSAPTEAGAAGGYSPRSSRGSSPSPAQPAS